MLLSIFVGEQAASAELSGEEVLKLMKANDAQFDNVLVEYDFVRYEHQISDARDAIGLKDMEVWVHESIDREAVPPLSKLVELFETYVAVPPNEPPRPVPPEEKKWVDLLREQKITIRLSNALRVESQAQTKKTASRNQMGLRWPDVAVEKRYGPRRTSKFSAIDQRTHLLFALDGPEREWFRDTSIDPTLPNVYQSQAIWLQLSLGIGYSHIVNKVTSFDIKDDSYQLNVEIDWWSRLTGKGVLDVDKSFVVRAADVTFGTSRVVVSTEGLYHGSGRHFACARKGQFKKFRGSKENLRFDVALQSVRFGITNAQFDELADMSTPDDETRYEIDKRGLHLVRRGLPLTNTRWWIWLVPNVVLVGVFAYFVVRRRFSGRRKIEE